MDMSPPGLSPEYIRFMVNYVGQTLHKHLVMRSAYTPDENAIMSLIVLNLEVRPKSRDFFLGKLEERGDLIVEKWNEFYLAVVRHNRRGRVDAAVSINQLMERGSNEGHR